MYVQVSEFRDHPTHPPRDDREIPPGVKSRGAERLTATLVQQEPAGFVAGGYRVIFRDARPTGDVMN